MLSTRATLLMLLMLRALLLMLHMSIVRMAVAPIVRAYRAVLDLSIALHRRAILALSIAVNVRQRSVRQNRIAQLLESLHNALTANRTRVIPPLDIRVMRMEIALSHALKELHIHLLRHRRALIPQKVIIIGEISAKHRQLR